MKRAVPVRCEPSGPRWESLALCDLTECLLHAYDFVARRAYEKFVLRGGQPGGELEDWLKAQRELLPALPVDFEQSDDFVYALSSVPGFTGAEIEVGIEPRWIVIHARHRIFTDMDDLDVPGFGFVSVKSSPWRGHVLLQAFCIAELPVEVDHAHAIAVLSNELLAIRMPKKKIPAPEPRRNVVEGN